MAPGTRKNNNGKPREAGLGFSAGAAGPCKQGSLVLLSGEYDGRGKGVEYWRERLGWMGEKPLRTVLNRYEAVGNPVHPDQSPGVRFVWVVTRGVWVEKAGVRDAASRRKVMGARPRGEDGSGPSNVQPAKRGPGRPKGRGGKAGAVGGGGASHPGGDAAAELSAPPPPPPAKGRKRKAGPDEAEVPTGETTTSRPKRVCRQPRRN